MASLKIASICLFKEFNLDLFITARCASGHSFRNPAERVMSVLDYGLQNCATETRMQDEKKMFFKGNQQYGREKKTF